MRTLLAPLLLAAALPLAAAPVHHDLDVTLDPASRRLEAVDRITVPEEPAAGGEIDLWLPGGFEVTADRDLRRRRLTVADLCPQPAEGYRLTLPAGERSFTLRYRGPIAVPASPAEGADFAGPDGVFLSRSSCWYPLLAAAGPRMPPTAADLTFSLRLHLPAGWRGVSQGAAFAPPGDPAGGAQGWREEHPQDDLYLIAGRYRQWRRETPWGEAQVWLHDDADDDGGLAERYLAATARYLDLYSRLIGPYPYAKFALVENLRETGYGMPSFTLLGPRVLRLPFILDSSYPHEILHAWWGNGVYVNYDEGNWSEGLTTYLADHLLQEQQGRGAAYRRDTLGKYADYAARGADLPLTAFRSRHNQATQAVGYGKSLFFFHLLRRELGEERFLAGLRRFWREQQFRRAGWGELRAAFEAAGGGDLAPFFAQWIERTGAPELHLGTATAAGNALTLTLRQEQPGEAYRLRVPLAVWLEGGGAPWEGTVAMSRTEETFTLPLPGRPAAVQVDPRFDLFRRLLPGEQPPRLDALFRDSRPLFVLPAAAPAERRDAYRRLAAAWSEGIAGAESVADDRLAALPGDRPTWLLGWENRFLPAVARQGVTASAATPAGQRLDRADYAVAVAAEGMAGAPLGWLGADRPAALPGLTRKLPHYGKYGYLAFTGDAPENRLKGQWEVTGSPLWRRLDGSDGELAPLPARPDGLDALAGP